MAAWQPDPVLDIRTEVLQGLSLSSGEIQKEEPYRVAFVIHWEPLEHYRLSGYGTSPDVALFHAIVLVGSVAKAQASTCEIYMEQTWGAIGGNTLRAVGSALVSKDKTSQIYKCNDVQLQILLQRSTVMAMVEGSEENIAQVGQQLAWLSGAFRSTTDRTEMAYCYPRLRISDTPIEDRDATFEISFEIESVTRDSWLGLFGSKVIVKDFPILSRGKEGPDGLEIPLEMMPGQIQANRVTYFDGRIYIKGYEAFLAPSRLEGDLVVWRMLYNDNGNRISYLKIPVDKSVEELDINGLGCKRHIVESCSRAD